MAARGGEVRGLGTMPDNLEIWTRRLVDMQGCKTVADLVSKFGEANHKIQEQGSEMWHYPLGVANGFLYSVHVSVQPDQTCQAYMFFEPTKLPDSPVPLDSPPARPWWHFSSKRMLLDFKQELKRVGMTKGGQR